MSGKKTGGLISRRGPTKGQLKSSFFKEGSFIKFFKTANADDFNVDVSNELYAEFINFYNATTDGAELRVSREGRD